MKHRPIRRNGECPMDMSCPWHGSLYGEEPHLMSECGHPKGACGWGGCRIDKMTQTDVGHARRER